MVVPCPYLQSKAFTTHVSLSSPSKSFECFCILDLDKLTTSQLSSRSLAIIKEQSAIDSICFPETMNKMIIVNAPAFFAATWRLIRGWLDPRTATKIEVISNRAAGEKRLLELVDSEQLPCDYGGTGPHTNDVLMESYEGEANKLDCRMLYLRYVEFYFPTRIRPLHEFLIHATDLSLTFNFF